MRVAAGAISVCVLLGSSSISLAAETSLRMTSEPGDYIGAGQEYFHTPADGTFTVYEYYGNGAYVAFSSPTNGWELAFVAPFSVPLTPQTYRGAQRWPFQEPSRPGLSVTGNGRGCNTLTGEFQIKEISYVSPGRVDSLWAIFEQHCEGEAPALRGDLRVNAHVVVAVNAPLNKAVERSHAVTIDVSGTDVLGRDVTLSAQGLPEGATFEDHGDGTGTLAWTPGFDQIGSYDVTFTGDNGEGGSDTATTRVAVQGTTSLLFDSDPGDSIGLGELQLWSTADGAFAAASNELEGASVTFVAPSYSPYWYLDFAAAQGVPLVPGTYTGAMRFPFQPPSVPGMLVYGDGRACSTLTGSFEVKQIERSDDTVSSFWATFEQHCEGAAPALRGEIRYNATVPIVLSAPVAVSAGEGRETVFGVSAVDGGTGPITLGATDLPDGATFTDHGDGSGTFRWSPTADQRGPHTMRWTASNAAGDTDTFPTRVTVRIANDDFDGAVTIPGLPFSDVRDTTTATGSPDDPSCGGSDASVWYDFTPESDTIVVLDTYNTNYYASVGVFTGSRGALDLVACDGGRTTYQALAGVTYHIRISSSYGGGTLYFSAMAPPPAPANDDFDHATVISSTPFPDAIDASQATTAGDDPYGCGDLVRTVWYAVTPARDGEIVVDTAGSDYYTSITAYTGSRGELEGFACSYVSLGFRVSAGVTYHVMVEDLEHNPSAHLALSASFIPALGIGVAIAPASSIDLKTGVAYVSGTVGCTRPAVVTLEGTVAQGAIHGAIETSVSCTGFTSWSAQVIDASGRFQAGSAEVSIHAVADDQQVGGTVETYALDSTVLKGGRIRGAPPTEPLRIAP